MSTQLLFVLVCAVVALGYGIWASRSVLSASAGSERMQTISAAIQEGASAYLNRQYRTIAMAGVVIFVIITFALGIKVGIGFLIGAVLSGATGFIGMNISVRANVRTAEAARQGLAQGLALAFRAGAVTGMLVAGLALLAIAGYYAVLLNMGFEGRELTNPLVGLGFGASLISIFARLGGGIFTKGADVGADLSGAAGRLRGDGQPDRRDLVAPPQSLAVRDGGPHHRRRARLRGRHRPSHVRPGRAGRHRAVAHAHADGDRWLPDYVRCWGSAVSRCAVRARVESRLEQRPSGVPRRHAATTRYRLGYPGLRATRGLTGRRGDRLGHHRCCAGAAGDSPLVQCLGHLDSTFLAGHPA